MQEKMVVAQHTIVSLCTAKAKQNPFNQQTTCEHLLLTSLSRFDDSLSKLPGK